jgi:hypothetical protein
MLDAALLIGGGVSLVAVQELQQVALYFYMHAWLGAFFVLQVLGLLVTKARADSINGLWGLHVVRRRLVASVARVPLSRARLNLFHYWF